MAATVKTDVAQMRSEQAAFWNAHADTMAAVVTKACGGWMSESVN